MRTICDVRDFINNNMGKNVIIKVKGIRNKNEIVSGMIEECYKNIFIVDTNTFKRSFSYKDILLGIIVVMIK